VVCPPAVIVHFYVALYVVALPALMTSAMFGPDAVAAAVCVEAATDAAGATVAVDPWPDGVAPAPHATSAIADVMRTIRTRFI
jgi:hypothetical protein